MGDQGSDPRDARYVTPLAPIDAEAVVAFWKRFRASGTGAAGASAAGSGGGVPVAPPEAWCFGDTVELADELLALVIDGPKRATAGSVAMYEAEGEALSAVGDLSVVADGASRPRVVIETTDVRVGPLSSVDDAFAWDEGEGDRTRAGWLDAHTWFFRRAHEAMGLEFGPDIAVVFERFAVIYVEA